MKEKIRNFALGLGADDVGIANAADYKSPQSPALDSIMPGARSLVVMAYKELSSCESPNMQIAMNGRLDVMEFSRGNNYKVARFVEKEGGKAMTAPISYPLEMTERTMGAVGDVSMRHAAFAAGLGSFGRNNLVLHPRFGSRVVYTVVLTDLDLPSDPPAAGDICTDCGLCVESCPSKALDQEGKTDVGKCLRNSQPYGIGGAIRFWSKFGDASPEEKKAMVRDTNYWRLYQANMIGFQYFCWNCMKSCPVGVEK